MLLQMNCTEFNSRDLGSFTNIYTDSPASYKAVRHRSRYFCGLQLEHKAPTITYINPHIARATDI